jgi:DNA-binding CsgD family transcriptional regulator
VSSLRFPADGEALLGLAYDIPFDQEWGPLLDHLTATLGLFSSDIVIVDRRSGKSSLYASNSVPQELVTDYQEHYARCDPFMPLAASRPVGDWLSSTSLPTLPWFGTEYHEDFLRRHGIEHIGGLSVMNDESTMVTLAVQRPPGSRTDERLEERLCRFLAPHLRRVVELQRQLAEAESQRAAAIEALHRLEIGVILLSSSGRVMAANRGASDMAGAGDGFALSREGPSAQTARDTDRLRGLIQEAVRTTQGRGFQPGGAMRLERPSGKRPYEVLVTPIAADRLYIGSRHAAALLFVTDPERTPRSFDEHLKQLYALTAAETELAMRLMTGASPAQIAEERGVSIHTVRAQLKSIQAKTDTRRQSELVRLLYRSVSAIASSD